EARAAEAAFTQWLDLVKVESREISLSAEYLRAPLNEGSGTNVAARLNGSCVKLAGPTELDWTTKSGPYGAAPVLTKDHSFLIGDAGDFEANEPFSLGAWIQLPKDFKGEGSLLARLGGEGEKSRGWDFFVKDQDFGLHLINRGPGIALKVYSIEKAVTPGVWEHLFVTYDGSGRANGVKLFVNGVEVKANRDQNRLEGSIRSPFRLRLGRRERGNPLA